MHLCVLLCMSLKKGTRFGAMVIHANFGEHFKLFFKENDKIQTGTMLGIWLADKKLRKYEIVQGCLTLWGCSMVYIEGADRVVHAVQRAVRP